MEGHRRTPVLWISIALLALATTVHAEKTTLRIQSSRLTTALRPGTQTVDYYVLGIPDLSAFSRKNIDAAFLEFYANVSARPETLQVIAPDSTYRGTYVYADEEPVLEIYALSGTYQGSIDLESLRQRPVSQQGIRPGVARRIRVDIAPLTASFITDPGQNHGFVLGSLSGRRTGIFDIDPNGVGSGTVATLTIYHK